MTIALATRGYVFDKPLPPVGLVSVTIIGPQTIELAFDRELANNANLVDPLNYRVFQVGVLVGVLAVTRISGTQVQLTLPEMKTGDAYTATAFNLVDLAGLPVLCTPQAFVGVGLAPVATMTSPLPDQHDVDRNADIVLRFVDANSGVDLASITVAIEGAPAFAGGVFVAPWNATGSRIDIIVGGYQLTFDGTVRMPANTQIDVEAHATDMAGNVL